MFPTFNVFVSSDSSCTWSTCLPKDHSQTEIRGVSLPSFALIDRTYERSFELIQLPQTSVLSVMSAMQNLDESEYLLRRLELSSHPHPPFQQTLSEILTW